MDRAEQQALHWTKYRQALGQVYVDKGGVVSGSLLAERGRLLAAHQIANDAEAKKRVEDAYGVELCRKMYPEAYRDTGSTSFIGRSIDKIRKLIPW